MGSGRVSDPDALPRRACFGHFLAVFQRQEERPMKQNLTLEALRQLL